MMRKIQLILILVMLLFASACSQSFTLPEIPEFSVPKKTGVNIDGKLDDWKDGALRVETLAPLGGRVPQADDLSAKMGLAWDERGLLLLVKVRDDFAREAQAGEKIFLGDCIHVHVAERRGGQNKYRFIVTPGLDGSGAKSRIEYDDKRKDRKSLQPLKVDYVFASQDDGYVFEALLPWNLLGGVAHEQAALQVYVADSDLGDGTTVAWYPTRGDWAKALDMQPLKMAASANGERLPAAWNAKLADMSHYELVVAARADMEPKNAYVLDDDGKRTDVVLARRGDLLEGYLNVPLSLDDGANKAFALYAGDRLLGVVHPPRMGEERVKKFIMMRAAFHPAVFQGDAFPKCDFGDPAYVRNLVGPYEISTTFYDADYNKVESPQSDGRYGAVVDIRPAYGPAIRQFSTVYRASGKLTFNEAALPEALTFPEDDAVDKKVLAGYSNQLSRYFRKAFESSENNDNDFAVLWAGLADAAREKAYDFNQANEPPTRDKAWWAEFRRRQSGNAEKYPADFDYPKLIEGTPTPVLRDGMLSDAGMKPGAVEAIDAVLNEYRDSSDRGFAVLVARKGVVVHHKAYGDRWGSPMTIDTTSYIASITKSFFGSCIMMLHDAGRIENLDDPAAKYLPEFRNPPEGVTTPLNLMHCMTHTNGMGGLPEMDTADFPSRMAAIYDKLPIGRWPHYNSGGYMIATRVLEEVSGEALPAFYRKHLLEPLGMDSTTVYNSTGDASTTAMDIAVFAQMLLNKGSYGKYRFFSEENYNKMIPKNWGGILTDPGRDWWWGVGLMFYGDEESPPLGPNTYGHGSATSCILRIDPDKELIIVMTRQGKGPNYDKYKKKLFETIYEQIEE